jgi:hypothetical protein
MIGASDEAIENIRAGWRARETYVIHGTDEFEQIFELAAPGKNNRDVITRPTQASPMNPGKLDA